MTITAARAPRKSDPNTDASAPLFVGQSTTGPGLPAAPHHLVDDFVIDVQTTIRRIASNIQDDTINAIGAAIRERWGGDRPYIAKRPGEGRSERNAAIRREFRRGDSIPLLSRRHNLGRRQILRIVGLPDEP